MSNQLARDTVKHNVYVDDCLQSVPTVSDGVDLAKDLMALCSEGGFRLMKWIAKEERAKEVKQLNLEYDKLPSERALGLQWYVEEDTLGFTHRCLKRLFIYLFFDQNVIFHFTRS